MIIFCLGVKSSGSTWVFNVIREIASYSSGNSISFFCEDADHFVRSFEPVDGITVVKCHYMDSKIIDLAKILRAKIVITERDPRDCAVSLSERFSLDTVAAVKDISRSFSSIYSIDDGIDLLKLRYEEDISFDVATVNNIAEFIGQSLGGDVAEQIATRMSRDAVALIAESLPSDGEAAGVFEPDTHWHRNHVGDGKVGKWQERLTSADLEIIEAALMPFYNNGNKKYIEIFWPASMFSFKSLIKDLQSVELHCDGSENYLVWGPYNYIPPGRWQVEYLIDSDDNDLTLKIDVNVPVESRALMGLKTIELRTQEVDRYVMEFDHIDPSHPIETRILSLGDGYSGDFKFSGIRLTRTGNPPRRKKIHENYIKKQPFC